MRVLREFESHSFRQNLVLCSPKTRVSHCEDAGFLSFNVQGDVLQFTEFEGIRTCLKWKTET